MGAQHTPGPWIPGHLGIDDHPCQCRSVVSEGYAGGICTVHVENSEKVGSRSIAEGFNDCPPQDEAVANMRLIAAAPELLNAVRALLSLHQAHHNDPIHAQAREIIRKSEGRS